MSTEFNHDGSITVIGYSLPEFCFELCDLAAKGFCVTMEGSKAPSGGFGSYYSAILRENRKLNWYFLANGKQKETLNTFG